MEGFEPIGVFLGPQNDATFERVFGVLGTKGSMGRMVIFTYIKTNEKTTIPCRVGKYVYIYIDTIRPLDPIKHA